MIKKSNRGLTLLLAITFVVAVVKTCIKECEKAIYDKHLLKVNKSTTAKAGKIFLKNIEKLKNTLK